MHFVSDMEEEGIVLDRDLQSDETSTLLKLTFYSFVHTGIKCKNISMFIKYKVFKI